MAAEKPKALSGCINRSMLTRIREVILRPSLLHAVETLSLELFHFDYSGNLQESWDCVCIFFATILPVKLLGWSDIRLAINMLPA